MFPNFSFSAFQHFSFSVFQLFSMSAFSFDFSISAFQHVSFLSIGSPRRVFSTSFRNQNRPMISGNALMGVHERRERF
jgi:hypothetical protein